jgi:hypothetical protein
MVRAGTSMASSMLGPMNLLAAAAHRPSSTRLPSMGMRWQSRDRAAWATRSLEGGGLAGAGFAAEQHVAFGDGDVDVGAGFVGAEVDGLPDRQRATGQAAMTGAPRVTVAIGLLPSRCGRAGPDPTRSGLLPADAG